MSLPALALSAVLSHTVEFDRAQLRLSSWNGYDVVEIDGGFLTPDPGQPALPEVNLTLAIPADAQVVGVTVTPISSTVLEGAYRIAPAQPARPLSLSPEPAPVPPDAWTYSSDRPFPTTLSRPHRTGSAAGFRLVSVSLFPVRYRPASGTLILHTRLRVEVTHVPGPAARTATPSQVRRATAGLASLVANRDDLSRYAPRVAESDLPEVQYLVVTADRLVPFMQPYVELKRSRGIPTELRTMEWVNRNYPGRDIQERLRNFIRSYYEQRGLIYVLLAGDNAEVPCRHVRLNTFDEEGNIPADIYYGDLDYSWDSNHNNLFGEMEDSVDLYADVLVGRASIQDSFQARTFINKVCDYEERPEPDYLKRALLPSGWLWRSIGYHGRFMNDSIANITPAGWTDRAMVNPSSARVVADSFDHGFALFDPAGHGNASGVYDEGGTAIYTTGVAGSQRNARRYSITTSLACDPGDFESEDCLAEVTHNCRGGGSVAVMMNSRYGWGTPPSIGPSELLCIRFFDFMLRRDAWNLGACHDRSREVYAASAQWSWLWRWCITEFNLFGDPTLDLWTEVPTAMAVTAADTIPTGHQPLTVTVTDGGSPVSGATVCAYKANEVLATGQTNGAGQVMLAIHPTSTGSLDLAASRHNRLPGTKTIIVTAGSPEPRLELLRASVSDEGSTNPNGILEPGEDGRVMIVVRNSGTATATDARVVLRLAFGGLKVLDSLAELGSIAPADTAVTSDLIIQARPDAQPGSSPELCANITSPEGTWELLFPVVLGYPGRTTAELDTGTCALTLCARGTFGFDVEGGRNGRGFRFPEHDTSCLNTASFVLGSTDDYVVDRFYSRNGGADRDWVLADSVRQVLPLWNADEMLVSGFTDTGHPNRGGIRVTQRGLAFSDPDQANFIAVVNDVLNEGSLPLSALYAGIMADFDVRATDRLHDVAYTLPELGTAFMRNVTMANRYCGVKLLYPRRDAILTCIDHGRYVYPDSGLTDAMKLRALQGTLGAPRSERPFNWSVSVSAGPFALGAGERQRLAWAFVAASDSADYVAACRASQDWFDACVGVAESPDRTNPALDVGISASPNPFSRRLSIRCILPKASGAEIRLYDASGRLVRILHRGRLEPDTQLSIDAEQLPLGVYLIRLDAAGQTASCRAVQTR